MNTLHDIVKNIIDAQKIDSWEKQHEAFCRLTKYVCQIEIEQFNKGYETAKKHYGRYSLADETMRIIEKNGGLRTPPISAM